MGEVISQGEGLLLSVSRLGVEFGVHRQTVAKRIASIAPAGKRSGFPVYRIKDVAEAIVAPADSMLPGDDDFDPAKLSPKERLDWYRSERERTRLDEESRNLIPVAEVEAVIATTISALAQGMRSIPDHMERKLGITADLAVAVSDMIDSEMNSLADRLSSLSSDQLSGE